MTNVQLHLGDCLEIMKTMPENSVDSIVCDPPAGISFMNLKFDSDRGGRTQWIAWMTEVAAECLRLLKPGGHALVWALPRTSHWTATAWEDAGFELRDCLYHIFGSGFPKSHSIDKALDRMAGAEREVVGTKSYAYPDTARPSKHSTSNGDEGMFGLEFNGSVQNVTAPATDAAKQYAGWGTSLKPSVECWWLLRKPLSEKNIAANVQAWGCGGLNIDQCRIEGNVDAGWCKTKGSGPKFSGNAYNNGEQYPEAMESFTASPQGRWPANLILDPEAAALLDEMSGVSKSPSQPVRQGGHHRHDVGLNGNSREGYGMGYGDQGGASRFFLNVAHDEDDAPLRFKYQSKASKRDRDEGLEGMEEQDRTARMVASEWKVDARHPDGGYATAPQAKARNHHPTVKPTALMQWLVRLVTPPGGTVLDCFAGSGSTGKAAVLEGFHFIGIELDEEYLAIAEKRIQHAQGKAAQPPAHMPQLPLLEMTGD